MVLSYTIFQEGTLNLFQKNCYPCCSGPSSKSVDTIMDLMQSGMTLALIPLSLGVRQEHIDTVANLRTANTAFSHTLGRVYPLAIAVQTKGPGLRIGGLKKVISNILVVLFTTVS